MMAAPPSRSGAVGNLLFFRRSCAYRNEAVEMMRKARAMPLGPERRAARQLARALKDLAKTEAWLEGQTPRLRPVPSDREWPHHAASFGASDVRSPNLHKPRPNVRCR